MAHFLQQLVGAKEPFFSTSLRQLEKMTGYKGVDVRYIADITARAHSVMRKIGLDPADTTKKELYNALNSHADNQELFIKTDDVGLIIGGDIISFNCEDIKINAKSNYEKRSVLHMRCQVQHAITARYVAADGDDAVTIDEIVSQAGMPACDMAEYHEHKERQQNDTSTPKPYILCIGDIFTDTFITLLKSEASVFTDDKGDKRLSIPFGNKPPYKEAEVVKAVGPSPNAGVACARLGLRVGMMSWLGDDQVGSESMKYLVSEHIDTSPMVIQKGTPSNSYYVLRYGADRTILVKNQDYKYQWKKPAQKPDWIYLSLISDEAWELHKDMVDYLSENPEIKLAFQPGTFQFKWGAKKLHDVYERAYIVVMNREEAVDVTGAPHEDIPKLAAALHAIGPEVVIITDGADGSYASYDDKLYKVPNYPDPAPPFDRTGAGDAFASTIVAALALGEPLEIALKWAPINSMSVVQKLGAQAGLLPRTEIEKYLASAPDWYKVQEIKL